MTARATTRPHRWDRTAPELTGAPDADAAALRSFTAAGEDLLAALPAKPDRTPDQQNTADEIHRRCRGLRAEFLRGHVDRVHTELTDGRSRSVRLAELAGAAAERFPGLVPTAAQLADERRHPQRDKEGREIDQGLFFGALLAAPQAAAHVVASMLRPTARARAALPAFRRTGVAELGCVHLERQGDTAFLTVRNLHCLNAEDDPSVDDMETAVDLVLLDEACRVGVVRGGHMTHPRYLGRRVFSAGINLKDLHRGRISFVDFLLRREIGYINKILRGLRTDHDETVEKPWVAAVDTFAIGGGAQLLLVFDSVVAATDSYVSLPAAKEGIVPGAANLRLSRAVGPRIARQMILGGAVIEATDPRAALLADRLVAPDAMEDTIAETAEQLSAPAVVANRRMLNLAEEPPASFNAYMAEFAVQQSRRAYSPDVLAKVARVAAKPSTT
ncbi:(3,5-dihydroxyphenyl)acetyl-CoA 1,2-dioxygenase DpgC [Streptomyces sp. HNM1019]|uniref:(3,5-dihydroxyphenyl)acetyl-CoA 1,2-dioxygenase DpgC n=1 Tax=Streptomyces sp. HNM1019 TaxID=3424717 RepID=UPI003D77DF2B